MTELIESSMLHKNARLSNDGDMSFDPPSRGQALFLLISDRMKAHLSSPPSVIMSPAPLRGICIGEIKGEGILPVFPFASKKTTST
jgi:hypothetical protein